MSEKIRKIGDIGNYYGGLSIKQEGDEFFWSIEDWDGEVWYKIPKDLFDALNKYENEKGAAIPEDLIRPIVRW